MLRVVLVGTVLLLIACKGDVTGGEDLQMAALADLGSGADLAVPPDLKVGPKLDATTIAVDAALRDLASPEADLAASEADLAMPEGDLASAADLHSEGDLLPAEDLLYALDLLPAPDLLSAGDLLPAADLLPAEDLRSACPDPGNWKTKTDIHTDSASAGTPDSYFITTIPCTPFSASIVTNTGTTFGVNVSNGTTAGLYCTGGSSCAITVPPGDTTLIVTAVTSDIGNYTLTITYAVPN